MCLLAKKRKGLKSFLAESRGKNWNYLFYPSAKSRRELKIKTLGVTFRGASAYYVQKSTAPQKQRVCRFSDEIFFAKIFIKIFCQKKIFVVENEMLGIVWNAFSQSLRPNGAIFEGETAIQSSAFFFGFRRRKMKCRESSETRFPKVSRRSDPSLRGKGPFKVSENFRNSRNRSFFGR